MPVNLNGVTVEYDSLTSVFDTVVLRNVVAVNSALTINQAQDILLGATGKISFAIGGKDSVHIREKEPGVNPTPVIFASNVDGIQYPLELKSTEAFGRVIVGGLETRTVINDNTDYITSVERDFIEIETSNLTVTGSAHCEGDFLANGSMIGKTMNVLRDFGGPNNKVGFGFSINDNEQLVLYKFDSRLGTAGITRRVNVFGTGTTALSADDADYPVFNGSNLAENNTLTVGGVATASFQIWSSNEFDNKIHYNGAGGSEGYVGIGTSNPLAPLHVNGDTRSLRYITGSGDFQMYGTTISGAELIQTSNLEADIITTSNLNITSLYDGTLTIGGGELQNASTVSTNNLLISESGNGGDLLNIREYITTRKPTEADYFKVNNRLTVIEEVDVSGAVIVSDIIPDLPDIRSLGSAEKPWKDLFLSGNTLYLGGKTISSDASGISFDSSGLTIGGKRVYHDTALDEIRIESINIGGLKISNTPDSDIKPFPFDLSALASGSIVSVKDGGLVAASLNSGGVLTDFRTVYGGEATATFTEYIHGNVNFGVNYDINRGYHWQLREFSGEIVPPAVDGSGVDLTSSVVILSGADSGEVKVEFIKDDNTAISTLSFVTPLNSASLLEYYPVAQLNPAMVRFRQKAKADFDYYFNGRLQELGSPVRSEFIYGDYVNMPSSALHVNGTKIYTVEFIAIRDPPIYNTENSTAQAHTTLKATSVAARANSFYRLNGATYDPVVDEFSAGLYPYIGYYKWDNSVEVPTMLPKLYDPALGWGSPDPSFNTAFAHLSDVNGVNWLLELYKITYLSVKYASPTAVPSVGDTIWTNNIDVAATDANSYFKLFVVEQAASNYNMMFQETTIVGKVTQNKIAFTKHAFGTAFA